MQNCIVGEYLTMCKKVKKGAFCDKLRYYLCNPIFFAIYEKCEHFGSRIFGIAGDC